MIYEPLIKLNVKKIGDCKIYIEFQHLIQMGKCLLQYLDRMEKTIWDQLLSKKDHEYYFQIMLYLA